MPGLGAEWGFAPVFGGRRMDAIDDGLSGIGATCVQPGLAADAAIGYQQSPPARFDYPVNHPSRMRLAQRGYRWKRVQDVAHGAQANHEQSKL